MLLKHATEEDIPFIIGAAKDLHNKFGGIDFDEETTKDTIYSFLEHELTECMLVVAYNEEKYLGVVAGMLSLTPFSTKRVANEPLFWTNGNPKVFKALHEAFRTWAAKVDADVVLLSAPPTREYTKWEKFYSKLGYEPYEYTFIKKEGN